MTSISTPVTLDSTASVVDGPASLCNTMHHGWGYGGFSQGWGYGGYSQGWGYGG